MAGFEVITEAEPFKANGNNLAVSNENERVVFALTDGTFRFEGTPDICIGMGGIAADLKIDRVLRK